MLLPGPECLMGSLYGLPLLLSPSPNTLCHVPLSGLLTLLVCSIFVIGCWQITGLPLLLPGP
ncbi:unnamed protein product [Staurois parvus]|uniref:NADH dehydrogenase subunit 1 n=1 Tax=Staurois parvus TaxID=386267 RepID=A0ABN9D0R4_9NEOB|nr:unnamed protein product [Staurois parvus]